MKKLFLASALGLFVLASSAGIVGHHFVETHAEGVKGDLAALMTSYISKGTYTKKTAIYLTDEVVSGNLSYFHARTNRMKITTYYDETAGALLMGGADGGFTFNSGFKNDGSGNCNHFRYSGYGDKKTSDLFTNISTDWKAYGQEVGNYYRTLTSLANYVSNSTDGTNTWTQSGSAFIHTIDRTDAGSDGYYYDETLHNFMFFAAPMLLDKVTETAFLNFTRIVIQPASSFLSIRLFTSASDEAKLQLTGITDAGDMLFSEARVYRGLSFNPGPHYRMWGAYSYGKDAWDDYAYFDYSPDTNVPEQYKASLLIKDNTFCFKVTDETNWWGIQHLSNWDHVSNGDEYNDDDIYIKAPGYYEFYVNPASGEQISTYKPTSYYLVGNNFGNWGAYDEGAVRLINQGDGSYKATVMVPADTSFKVMEPDGDVWYGESSIEGAGNMWIKNAGNYTFTFYPAKNSAGKYVVWEAA